MKNINTNSKSWSYSNEPAASYPDGLEGTML